MMRRLSIRFQIIAIVVATTMLAILCSMVLFSSYDLSQFRAKLTREATAEGKILAQNSSAALSFGDSKAANEVLSSIDIKPEVETATLFDSVRCQDMVNSFCQDMVYSFIVHRTPAFRWV